MNNIWKYSHFREKVESFLEIQPYIGMKVFGNRRIEEKCQKKTYAQKGSKGDFMASFFRIGMRFSEYEHTHTHNTPNHIGKEQGDNAIYHTERSTNHNSQEEIARANPCGNILHFSVFVFWGVVRRWFGSVFLKKIPYHQKWKGNKEYEEFSDFLFSLMLYEIETARNENLHIQKGIEKQGSENLIQNESMKSMKSSCIKIHHFKAKNTRKYEKYDISYYPENIGFIRDFEVKNIIKDIQCGDKSQKEQRKKWNGWKSKSKMGIDHSHTDKSETHTTFENGISQRDFGMTVATLASLPEKWKERNELSGTQGVMTVWAGTAPRDNAAASVLPATDEYGCKATKEHSKAKEYDKKQQRFHLWSKEWKGKEIGARNGIGVMCLEWLTLKNALQRRVSDMTIHILENSIAREKIRIERA